jgi:serine/threonine protein kinase
VFDYGNVDGMPYIVMEYVDGGSLHEAAWNKTIEPIQAVAIINGICDGLAHAHKHGIVHRDIKPSNILLTLKAQPKVTDFGLARASDSDQSGLAMGTPGYTAPEVLQDPDQAGQLADVYSVGVILHQLLTGIDPEGSLGPPTQPTGNPHLDAIWCKATHITPAQRYATIAAMASDLKKWSAAKQKATVAANVARSHSTQFPVQAKTGGGGSVLVKLIIIGILVAAIVFSYQHLQENKQETKGGIADINGTGVTPDPKPDPDPDPIAEVKPDPAPIEVGVREEPVIPPVVVSIPEPEPIVAADLPPGDPELRTRAIGLILEARKKRDKELAKNARALLFQLGSRARNAKKDEAAFIERLKGDVIDNRVPLTEGVIGLPDKLTRDFEQARSKEAVIDKACLSALTRIRDAYVPRLEKAAAETSDAQLKPRLLAQSERAKDLDAWIGLLAPEPKWVPKKSSGAFGGGDFVGNWDHYSNGAASRRIAHRDGRMEIVGKDWKATWKILENGTLEINSGKIRPSILTRKGNGWTGKGPFGQDLSLTRGDW